MQHFINFHASILKKFELFITENKTLQQKLKLQVVDDKFQKILFNVFYSIVKVCRLSSILRQF